MADNGTITGAPRRRGDGQQRAFGDARAYARTLAFTTRRDWGAWAQTTARPPDIPSRPDLAYKGEGWLGWSDWLGSTRPRPPWRPFPQAQALARSLGVRSSKEWRAWCRTGARPADIPSNPDLVYRSRGWQGWNTWLGTEERRRRPRAMFRPFHQARRYARTLGLQSSGAWFAWARTPARPRDIPAHPDQIYRTTGWSGWADWLGRSYGRKPRCAFRPFPQARRWARGLGLRRTVEWHAWAKSGLRPADIPANPARTYREQGWAGYPDWLGTHRRPRQSRAPQGE